MEAGCFPPPFDQSARRLTARSAYGSGDLRHQAVPLLHVLAALVLQAFDDLVIFVGAALARVQAARLQYVHVCLFKVRHAAGDLITEIGVVLPFNRAFSDGFDNCRRMMNADFLRALVTVAAADAASI